MPTVSARSTAAQRATLQRLAIDLREAYDSLPNRFFSTRGQRASYEEVLKHLQLWASWERD